MTELKLDWCSYQAAKYAVEHWHYSRSMPAAPVSIGVWEDDKFIGAVLFARSATNNIGRPYNLKNTECVELVRVALNIHSNATSKIVSMAVKMIRKQSPGLRLLVSYADTDKGHNGIIYQAMNWIYTGDSVDSAIIVHGQKKHRRTLGSNYGTNSLEWIRANIDKDAERQIMKPKRKYLMPLDDAMRKQIAPLAKPYPKRETCGTGEIDNAAESNPQIGGASPTVPLSEPTIESTHDRP